jgi:hypothetical protein
MYQLSIPLITYSKIMCILFIKGVARPEKTEFIFKELQNAGFEQTQG